MKALVLLSVLLVACSGRVVFEDADGETCANDEQPNGFCETDDDCDPADWCDVEELATGPGMKRARYRCRPYSIAGEWCMFGEDECAEGLECKPTELRGSVGVCQ